MEPWEIGIPRQREQPVQKPGGIKEPGVGRGFTICRPAQERSGEDEAWQGHGQFVQDLECEAQSLRLVSEGVVGWDLLFRKFLLHTDQNSSGQSAGGGRMLGVGGGCLSQRSLGTPPHFLQSPTPGICKPLTIQSPTLSPGSKGIQVEEDPYLTGE